jgi:predicted dehydrogenase
MHDRSTIAIALAGLGDDDLALARHVAAQRRIAPVWVGDGAAGELAAQPGARGAADLDGALEDPAVEAVWLGAGGWRLQDARRVAAAGRALLLSGPPAATVAELEALAEVAEEHRVPVAVVHRRDSPPFARAAAFVAEGRLGLPRSVLVHLLEAGEADGERQLFEAVDAIRAIVGLDPLGAYAAGSHDDDGTRVTIVELERDVPATVVAGRAPGADAVAAGLRRVVLVGSQGMLAFEEDRPRLEVRGADARPGDGGAVAARARALVQELAGMLREGRPPVCGLDAARSALAVVAAARTAARERAVTAVAAADVSGVR